MTPTLAEYLEHAGLYWIKNASYQRIGQAYMNALHEVRPTLAQAITNTNIDPFYDDTKVPTFLAFVAERW